MSLCLVGSVALASTILLPPGHSDEIERANRLFAEGKYESTAEIYRRVQADLPESPIPAVNLGAATFKTGKLDDAQMAFRKASEASDPAIRGRAAYGLGSCRAKSGDLEGALASFKEAVELLPDDEDAKWNYEWVKRKLDEQKKQEEQSKEGTDRSEMKDDEKKSEDQQPKDERKDDDDKGDGEQKAENEPSQREPQPSREDSQNEPSPKPPEDDSQKEPKPSPDSQGKADEKKAQPVDEKSGEPADDKPPAAVSKDEIERLLESLLQDEKAQRRLVRRAIPVPRGAPKKDW